MYDVTRFARMILPTVRKGNCVLWLGSGLSCGVGYLGWGEMVRELCQACGVPCLGADEEDDADALIDRAEQCKQANVSQYQRKLVEVFGRPVVRTRQAYVTLIKLPFKAYVTSNSDPLLYLAGRNLQCPRPFVYPSLPSDALGSGSKPVYYIHGLIEPNQSSTTIQLVLARSDFDQAYGEDGAAAIFLKQLLPHNDLVVLGGGLREPDMYPVFDTCRAMSEHILRLRGGSPPVRYALLSRRAPRAANHQSLGSTGKREYHKQAIEDQRLADMGISVVRYKPSDPSQHDEIDSLAEILFRSLGTPEVGPADLDK